MHPILDKQNEAYFIKLLKASSIVYSKAKRGEVTITTTMVLLSFIYPVIYLNELGENVKIFVFALSFLLSILVQLVKTQSNKLTQLGAVIKEEFDTSLFGLPWKRTISRPQLSEISHFAQLYTRNDITNWYSISVSKNLPDETAVALLQYSNTIWDIKLRQKYLFAIKGYLIFYTMILFGVFVYFEPKFEIIFFTLFSLLSFYTHFISIIKGHTTVIRRRTFISQIIDSGLKERTLLSKSFLRDIQDEIYQTRTEIIKVPNFFFRLFKSKLSIEIDKLVGEVF